MSAVKRIPLKAVCSTSAGSTVSAPPVLDAITNGTEFTCASCAEVLLRAEPGQVHHVVIRCTVCQNHNATDG